MKMGWWTQGNGDLVVGDEPLDRAAEFLRAVAALYEESELGRKPTASELAATIELALSSSISSVIDGGERLGVSKVTVKTKRQPKKHKVRVGDIFAVRLRDGAFGFGRVMTVVPKKGDVIEYFRVKSYTPIWRPRYAEQGRLGLPKQCPAGALEDRIWPVVAHDENYEPTKEDKNLEFAGGMPPHMWSQDIFYKTVRDRIDVAEGKSLPRLEAGQEAVQEAWLLEQLQAQDGSSA